MNKVFYVGLPFLIMSILDIIIVYLVNRKYEVSKERDLAREELQELKDATAEEKAAEKVKGKSIQLYNGTFGFGTDIEEGEYEVHTILGKGVFTVSQDEFYLASMRESSTCFKLVYLSEKQSILVELIRKLY